jgi:hypothetical protein
LNNNHNKCKKEAEDVANKLKHTRIRGAEPAEASKGKSKERKNGSNNDGDCKVVDGELDAQSVILPIVVIVPYRVIGTHAKKGNWIKIATTTKEV